MYSPDEHAELIGKLVDDLFAKKEPDKVLRRIGCPAGISPSQSNVTSAFCGRIDTVSLPSLYSLLRSMRLLGCLPLLDPEAPPIGCPAGAAWVTVSCSDEKASLIKQAILGLDDIAFRRAAEKVYVLVAKPVIDLMPACLALEDLAAELRAGG
jgi:hypothetical protein